MGLANGVFGMYGGIMVISVPQLLSARHVPKSTIAAMTTVMLSPGFWAFLVSPVLDVRFSRRWYSVTTAAAAALLLVLALLNLAAVRWRSRWANSCETCRQPWQRRQAAKPVLAEA